LHDRDENSSNGGPDGAGPALASHRAATHHRIKNLLAVIRTLSRRTLETATDFDDYASHLDGRLDALGRVHAAMALRPDAAVGLEELVHDELRPLLAQEDARASVVGGEVRLQGRHAELMALAIHELAVNSVKYGALGAPRAQLQVQWGVNERLLSLCWLESDVPLVQSYPLRTGFGRQLIEEGLPYQIGATTSFEVRPGGLSCEIVLPLVTETEP
jgi:two-component system CheB/CheR fusion protein